MKSIYHRLLKLIILLCFLGLGSCEKWEPGDDQACVRCYQERDEDVNWMYNVMPSKLCKSTPAQLESFIKEKESQGYNCGKITKNKK